ncbi:heavy metal-binding domain-containing protein [Myxococcus hansupus]|uniref:heavy metal-binding domain-containing protein n=1 Tax=Pseudomyxococcus hansupus TaxID=1297742 RepID=UPI001D048AFE
MHPELRQDKPGTCPNCGMAFEPEFPSWRCLSRSSGGSTWPRRPEASWCCRRQSC